MGGGYTAKKDTDNTDTHTCAHPTYRGVEEHRIYGIHGEEYVKDLSLGLIRKEAEETYHMEMPNGGQIVDISGTNVFRLFLMCSLTTCQVLT